MSFIDEAIQAHFDNGAHARFSKIDNFNGGTLEIPENIISKKNSKKCIYEIDDDVVNIYIDGIKERTIKCVHYACRPLVSIDMVFRMTNMGYTTYLLKVKDKEKEFELHEILQTKTAANLLDEPSDRKTKTLENKLYKAIETFYETGEKNIPDAVSEGFEMIQRHYNGELNAIAT